MTEKNNFYEMSSEELVTVDGGGIGGLIIKYGIKYGIRGVISGSASYGIQKLWKKIFK